ncbi:hemolysin family protein [Planococcus ruber]|uniref:hemolysin family protein n=1 Tax=Planococcus ruber TaxID=2027871 RepID=UPI001FEE738B|nr:hemolysin family protein [Planococcus ruber]MCJ1909298.1 hemolysin family protein [Planococcus ruber]
MDIPIQLAASAVLIAALAFFSASEFAIVKVRISRIDQLLADQQLKNKAVKSIIAHADNYLFACQLGIVMCTLGIGWLSYSIAAHFFPAMMAVSTIADAGPNTIVFFILFALLVFTLVIVSELIPKTFAAKKAESILLANAGLLIWTYRILFIPIALFKAAARLLSSLFGFAPASQKEWSHTEEDIKTILSDSLKNGEINVSEFEYVHKIFEFDERIAREIKVPRTAMCTLEKDSTLREVFKTVGVQQYTRYPVIDGDRDHVLGVVNMKNLMAAFIHDPTVGDLTVEQFMKPVIQVIETIKINELLLKIQQERIHLAILQDEYGGTSGLVTIEDILEEIVGEIQDEFDGDEIPEIRRLGDSHYLIDAKILIGHVNELLGIRIDDDDIDTIGGWFMSESFDTIRGQKIIEQGYEFLAKDVEGHHILYLEVQKAEPL